MAAQTQGWALQHTIAIQGYPQSDTGGDCKAGRTCDNAEPGCPEVPAGDAWLPYSKEHERGQPASATQR